MRLGRKIRSSRAAVSQRSRLGCGFSVMFYAQCIRELRESKPYFMIVWFVQQRMRFMSNISIHRRCAFSDNRKRIAHSVRVYFRLYEYEYGL